MISERFFFLTYLAMITASVVQTGFSEELSRVPLVDWLNSHRETPGSCQLPLAPAKGKERPLLPQDQVLPITVKTPHAQGVTMEAHCSVHPWILFQASLAVSGPCLQRRRFRDSGSYSHCGDESQCAV